MKSYRDIFFDLDRTIWDFEKNSRETIAELIVELNLNQMGITDFDQFYQHWKEANQHAWDQYRNDEKSKEEIRISRFVESLSKYNIDDRSLSEKMSSAYLQICPEKPHLIEGAKELLDYLNGKYRMHLITNGFAESQKRKLKACGLNTHFKSINISDETPFRKPQTGMFHLALQRALAKKENSIMIGDDINKDIIGAKKVGIDQIHYNPHSKSHKYQPTYTVKSLKEIFEIL